MVICLARDVNNLHMVHLMPLPHHHLFVKIQIGLAFLVPAYPNYTGKRLLNGCLSVCLTSATD